MELGDVSLIAFYAWLTRMNPEVPCIGTRGRESSFLLPHLGIYLLAQHEASFLCDSQPQVDRHSKRRFS